jgi:hypothetical protein
MRKRTVALNLPKSDGSVLLYAKHVAACMDGNACFPAPPVPITTLAAHAAELEAAQVTARTRLHGAAAARDQKRVIVEDDLRYLRTYVESVASRHAEDASAVIASSGMSQKQSAGPRKATFAVKQGRSSGSVTLTVRHPGIVASFDRQISLDGTHWTEGPSTVHASVDLEGLTPGTTYWFRYRTLTRNGSSDWSDPIKLLVV